MERGLRKLIFVFLAVFFYTSLSINLTSAAIGVTPSVYEIDFEPNLKKILSFTFFTDEGVALSIYKYGDLSEYAKLNTKEVIGSGTISVLLELPEKIEKPGKNRLYVGGKQVAKETDALGIIGDIVAVVVLRVPYPGEYAEIDFSASNANAGEPIDFKLTIHSRGNKSISADSYIEIYDSQENKVEDLYLGLNVIAPKESVTLSEKWNTFGKVSGRYKAVAVVEYGGEEDARLEKGFRIGELYVDVADYTKELERNKINRLDIVAESFWNDPIENLFANVSIIDYNLSFLTPSSNLKSFGKTTLIGYFDTTPIDKNKFRANITLNYAGKTTEKIVDLRFKREINYFLVGGIFIILVIIVLFVILIRRNRLKK